MGQGCCSAVAAKPACWGRSMAVASGLEPAAVAAKPACWRRSMAVASELEPA